MQQSIDAQQQQIQQLMQQLQSRDQQIQQLQQQMNQVQSTANQAQQKADTAVSQSTQQKQDVAAVRSDVTDLKDTVTNTALAMQETQKTVNESPLALRFKGITLTPGGFLAAETVWRQRGLASDVNTPFNSIPLPGSSQSNLSEFFCFWPSIPCFPVGRRQAEGYEADGLLRDGFPVCGSHLQQQRKQQLHHAATAGVGTGCASWLEFYRRSNVEPGHGNQKRCG